MAKCLKQGGTANANLGIVFFEGRKFTKFTDKKVKYFH
jgi:hypothetical protein